VTVVDSSGWIEFFTDGPLADRFAAYFEDLSQLVTPTVVVFEVYRVIRRERTEEDATEAVAQIQRTRVVDLDQFVALTAADLSLKHRLAMADALVYATALVHDADVATLDVDFEGLPGATVFTPPS
jgi:predicted nucleic acid-binding protein